MKIQTFIVNVAIILIAPFMSYADENSNLLPRCGQTAFDLCGFIDAEIWEKESRTVFIIEPKFEDTKNFSEGLAAVQIDGKYGYIDPSGEIVIQPRFERAEGFDQGLAAAGLEDVVGIINRSGEYVVEPAFAQVLIFTDQVILAISAENAEQGWADIWDYTIFEAGLYHIKEGWLTEQIYNFKEFDNTRREFVWAQISEDHAGALEDMDGLMRADGSWLIKPQFSYASDLKYDWAIVRRRTKDDNLSGAIDSQGNIVIPIEFDYLTHWDESFLLAGEREYSKRRFGLVNRNGELLANRYFDEIERPDRANGPDDPEQDFFSIKDGGEWKTLLKDGTLLTGHRIGKVYLDCDQFQIIYTAKGYALKPKDKNLPTVLFDDHLFPYTNRRCSPPPTLITGETYAKILENGAVFGEFYENSGSFFGTHLWMSVDDKWGLVDAGGTYAIAPTYDAIFNEKNIRVAPSRLPSAKADTTYKVFIGDVAYRIRFTDGIYKQEPFTELDEQRRQTLACKGKLKRKSKDGLWGIVDQNGDELIQPKYRAISCFSGGVAWVSDDVQRKWCPIGPDGEDRAAPPCEDDYYPIWRSHADPEKFHEDPYESNVPWD